MTVTGAGPAGLSPPPACLLNPCVSLQADSPGDGFNEGRQVGAEEGERPPRFTLPGAQPWR